MRVRQRKPCATGECARRCSCASVGGTGAPWCLHGSVTSVPSVAVRVAHRGRACHVTLCVGFGHVSCWIATVTPLRKQKKRSSATCMMANPGQGRNALIESEQDPCKIDRALPGGRGRLAKGWGGDRRPSDDAAACTCRARCRTLTPSRGCAAAGHIGLPTQAEEGARMRETPVHEQLWSAVEVCNVTLRRDMVDLHRHSVVWPALVNFSPALCTSWVRTSWVPTFCDPWW